MRRCCVSSDLVELALMWARRCVLCREVRDAGCAALLLLRFPAGADGFGSGCCSGSGSMLAGEPQQSGTSTTSCATEKALLSQL